MKHTHELECNPRTHLALKIDDEKNKWASTDLQMEQRTNDTDKMEETTCA